MNTLTAITRDDGVKTFRFKTSEAGASAFRTMEKDAAKIGIVALFLHDQGGALDMAITIGDAVAKAQPAPVQPWENIGSLTQ